jgi:hypothetical protein
MVEPDQVSWVLSRARTASGICAAGLVALVVALLVVGAVASAAGDPGPGPTMLLGHSLAAAGAVVLHRVARVRTGCAGYLAAIGPPAILLLLGVLFWWS